MQLLSPIAFGQSVGTAEIQLAIRNFSDIKHVMRKGFEYDSIPAENVDFFNGPDIVVGYMDDPDGCSNNPLLAFIYDELCFSSPSNNCYNHYQARVIFEASLDPDDNDITCSVLGHALTLMSLKANLHSNVTQENISITLGIHEGNPYKIPDLMKTMIESGFKREEDTRSENRQLQLYKMNTRPQ
jgi:hypothetical protein